MSKTINELAEIVLDRVYKMGWEHRSAIEKHHETAAELVAAERKLRETDQELQWLRQRHVEVQSEELAAAQAEIETLRQERDLAQVEAETVWVSAQNLQKDRDHWRQARQDAIEAGELMRAEIETLKGAMDADDKRLLDAEEKVWPGATFGCDAAEKMADEILYLRQQLANAQQELSEQGQVHGVELQRETADLRQQLADAQREAVNLQKLHDDLRPRLNAAQGQLTRERLDAEERARELERLRREDNARLGRLVEARGHELERLWAFVAKARDRITWTMKYCDVEFLLSALSELDAGTTEPTPVAEPLGAEGGE